MKFFVPGIADGTEAEEDYQEMAKYNESKGPKDKRVWRLKWPHNGMAMICEVGKPLPKHYQTGDEPVLAIYEEENLYMICTKSRGGFQGSVVYAGKEGVPEYFD